MEIGVRISWKVIVNGQVDAFDIDTTTKDICSNANALIEFFKFLVTLDTVLCLSVTRSGPLLKYCGLPFLLADPGVDRNGWKVTLAKKLVQLSCSEGAFDKDDDLIELKLV